jgi:hypothetical protein
MPPAKSSSVRRPRSQRANANRKDERMADETVGAVDVTAAVAQLDETITALETEIETDENALGVKRARLDALKRGRKGLEAAADPDIQPRKRPGRKPKGETVAA